MSEGRTRRIEWHVEIVGNTLKGMYTNIEEEVLKGLGDKDRDFVIQSRVAQDFQRYVKPKIVGEGGWEEAKDVTWRSEDVRIEDFRPTDGEGGK